MTVQDRLQRHPQMRASTLEEWKPVKDFEGLYEVSSLGKIRCLPRHRVRGGILKTSSSGKGYRKVQLCHKDRIVTRYVHDIVLTAFVGPRPAGQEAAHGDGKRDNNQLSNLRWDTRSGNHADKILHGTDNRGEKHRMAKLSEMQVREILSLKAKEPSRDLAKRFNISIRNINQIHAGKVWRHLQ